MLHQIWCDLVIGNCDDGIIPLSDDCIENYVQIVFDDIILSLCEIIEDRENKGNYDELKNYEPSWIREYLYENVLIDIESVERILLQNGEKLELDNRCVSKRPRLYKESVM